jgi:hypothetical protein
MCLFGVHASSHAPTATPSYCSCYLFLIFLSSLPKVAELLTEFFVRTVGRYRPFVAPETPAAAAVCVNGVVANGAAAARRLPAAAPRSGGGSGAARGPGSARAMARAPPDDTIRSGSPAHTTLLLFVFQGSFKGAGLARPPWRAAPSGQPAARPERPLPLFLFVIVRPLTPPRAPPPLPAPPPALRAGRTATCLTTRRSWPARRAARARLPSSPPSGTARCLRSGPGSAWLRRRAPGQSTATRLSPRRARAGFGLGWVQLGWAESGTALALCRGLLKGRALAPPPGCDGRRQSEQPRCSEWTPCNLGTCSAAAPAAPSC